MQTFKDSLTGKIYQYDDDVDVSKLASAPKTLKPHIAPAPTQADLDALALAVKWTTYAEYCSTLTVTTVSGHKYSANDSALAQVALKRDAISDTDTPLWIEDWGNFETTKVELQEVAVKAEVLKQAKIVELFGAV